MEPNKLNNWKFIKCVPDIEDFYIDTINIWDHRWVKTNTFVKVIEPRTNKILEKQVYSITSDSKTIYFVAFELSSNMFGIYLNQNYSLK
jgi:hypothetical protein